MGTNGDGLYRVTPIGFVSQVLGGLAAGGTLFVIASGKAGFDVSGGFASNGYGAHSPGGYSLTAALVTEVVMTVMFLVIILGATDARAPKGFAPIVGALLGAGAYRFIGSSEGSGK